MKYHKTRITDEHRRRLREHGADVLLDAELLAVILARGSAIGDDDIADARAILTEFGGWHGLLAADPSILDRRRGIGPATVALLRATFGIARRLLVASGEEHLQIKSPSDVATLLNAHYGYADQEHLITVCLNTKNRVQKLHVVYIGSVNSAIVRIGEVFKEALKLNSAAVIIAHNHPSQDCTPSAEDVLVTRQIVEAGKLLDVDVLDHLVFSHGRFVSMRERGLGFKG